MDVVITNKKTGKKISVGIIGVICLLLSIVVVTAVFSSTSVDNDTFKARAIDFLTKSPVFGMKVDRANIEIRHILPTDADDWKAVVAYVRRGVVKNPVVLVISKDGRNVVPGQYMFVDGKPVLSQYLQYQPEDVKVDMKFEQSKRIVFNPKGKQTLLVFYDPDCAFCKRLHDKIEAYKGDEYRFVIKSFPLPMHPEARGKLLKSQELWLVSNGVPAHQARVEAEKLVDEDIQEGKAAGITGTPTVIAIDGTPVDYSKLKLD